MSNKNRENTGEKQETAAPVTGAAGTDTQQGNAGSESGATEEPKVSDALVKIGKALLKSNPAMSVVYMASDGRGFYEKNDADNHAHTLKNKTVTPVKK